VFCRYVDQVLVVGRKTPVQLLQPICALPEVDDDMLKCDADYQRALKMMQSRHFADALNMLKDLNAQYPDDGMYEVMMARVEAYLSHPPSKDWDGVFVLDSK